MQRADRIVWFTPDGMMEGLGQRGFSAAASASKGLDRDRGAGECRVGCDRLAISREGGTKADERSGVIGKKIECFLEPRDRGSGIAGGEVRETRTVVCIHRELSRVELSWT